VSDDAPTGGRRPYRPPVGLPEGNEQRRRWRGLAISIAIHTGIIVLLLLPPITAAVLIYDPHNAGFLGRLRGGGGGSHGIPERLHYLDVAPPAPTPTKPKAPPPQPTTVMPQQVPPPAPIPPPSTLKPTADSNLTASAGGATGPGPGAGPGTGGGIGAGNGTGIGNGKGPGTGGDGGAKIKATAKLVTAYSVDPPKHPRPFHLIAVFEVAANGAARLLSVNKADDGDFNKKMRDHLLETEFRPATLANGTPVVDTVVVTADY
jgi:periplasmic protein TonB